MLAPRWRKVLADLRTHLGRTVIVVLSIAVGVFGVGMIAGAYDIMSRDLSADYLAARPASARLFTSPFGEDLVRTVSRDRQVAEAQGRRRFTTRVRVQGGQWKTFQLYGMTDFDPVTIDEVTPESGAWPPPDRQVVLERSAVEYLGITTGDRLEVEMPDGKTRQVRVAGLAHDVTHIPAKLGDTGWGFVTMKTLEWLGEPGDFNQLNVTVKRKPLDESHIRDVAAGLRDREVEGSDRTVYTTYIPTPGKHPVDYAIQTALYLFGALGFLSLFLAGFLVVNTIEALMAQQVRQIGIMKAVGARAGQITGVYLATVFIYGLLGLAVGIPAAALAARAITTWVAGLFNFDISSFEVPARVLALEVSVGLVVPLLAALAPILSGTRVPTRQAMMGFGLGPGRFGKSRLDRLLERPTRMPRQLLLSVRNTFRHKGRLVLTLITLTLGGAIFIAVMSVRASMLRTIDDIAQYWRYDATARLERSYSDTGLARAALKIPGVTAAEGWSYKAATRIRRDDSEFVGITVIAPPADSRFVRPTVLSGRWVRRGDSNEIVVNTDFLREEKDVALGDEITLDIEGKENTWRVVGINTGEIRGPLIYADLEGFGRIQREEGRVNRLMVATSDHSPAAQQKVATTMEKELKGLGYDVQSTDTNAVMRAQIEYRFNILVMFLLMMAVILAAVGGLGLMGTMSINVIERTREIAVMRAIGASDRSVMSIFLTEGLIVGLLGCFLGTLAAVPMSRLLSDTVGTQFFGSPLSYAFSPGGAGIWLVIALVMAALASLLPARRASKISVQEALAYE